MKTLAIAIIALTFASIYAAALLTAILFASLVHPLAPLGVILAIVCAILVYVEVTR